MTTEFFNANVKIVNVKNVTFKVSDRIAYQFNSGFAFFVPGFGYAKFNSDPYPYVLGTKKVMQSIIDAGGFLSMENISFVQA